MTFASHADPERVVLTPADMARMEADAYEKTALRCRKRGDMRGFAEAAARAKAARTESLKAELVP